MDNLNNNLNNMDTIKGEARVINNGLNLDMEREEQLGSEKVFGALSPASLVTIPEAERDNYLPVGELQFSSLADFKDCASRSPVNHLEALFTYHYQREMKPENKKWLEENGYIKDSKVTFSDRFVAIGSNTTKQGNSLKAPIHFIHKNGLIPKTLLPKIEGTFEEYHDRTKMTSYLYKLGIEFTKRFELSYEQVSQNHFDEVLKDDMLGVAAHSWPAKVNGVYPRTEKEFNHAFILYKHPKWQAFDNYGEDGNNQDFTKNLAPNYKFFDYAYRIYLSKENVPSDKVSRWKALLNKLQILLNILNEPLPPVITPTPPPPPVVTKLTDFCEAIRQHEGWFKDSRSWRNNNPGNVKFSPSGYSSSYGVVKKDKDNFAIFKDYDTGWRYLKNLVLSKVAKNPNQTILQFFHVYAPTSENDTLAYAKYVAGRLGVTVSYQMKYVV